MQVQFVERENRPERLVCEAEIHFAEGPLAGTRLVGFSLWRSPEAEIFVTFPSRALGVASERRFSTTSAPSTARPRRSSGSRAGSSRSTGRSSPPPERQGGGGEPLPPVLSKGSPWSARPGVKLAARPQARVPAEAAALAQYIGEVDHEVFGLV